MGKLRNEFINQYNPDSSESENTSEYLTSIWIVLDESQAGQTFVMLMGKWVNLLTKDGVTLSANQ